MIDQVDASMKERLADVRGALADRRDLRELLMGLFPKGLVFSPARTPDGARAVWKMSGPAVYKVLEKPAEPASTNLRRDPNVARCNRDRHCPNQHSRRRAIVINASLRRAGMRLQGCWSIDRNRGRFQSCDL